MERKKIVIASFWVVGAFGLSQVLRLASNLVVTRLLEPELFGLMAIVFVIMHGLAMFSDLGLWAFVVRHKEAINKEMLDTVWTIQVIRGWVIFVLIAFSAFLIWVGEVYWDYKLYGIYGDDKFPVILLIASIVPVLAGYKTMAPALESRKLKRGKLELVELVAQVSAAIVMITWAWFRPTIWALVSAGIVSAVVRLSLIYFFFPLRHHFKWNKKIVAEVYDFGKWIVFASVLTYIAGQGDRLFFGASITATQLGIYSVAFMLANTINSIMNQLATKVLFPVFSGLVHGERTILKKAYYSARLRLDIVTFSLAGVLLAIAPVIIEFLYDERYYEAGSMLQILVFSIIGSAFSITALECLSALSITKVRMQVMLVRSLGLLIGLPVCFSLYGFYGALWVVATNIWLGLPLIFWVMYKQSVLSLLSEIKAIPLFISGYYLGILLVNGL